DRDPLRPRRAAAVAAAAGGAGLRPGRDGSARRGPAGAGGGPPPGRRPPAPAPRPRSGRPRRAAAGGGPRRGARRRPARATHARAPPRSVAGSLTDFHGLLVGHASDPAGGTGCTAVLCPGGAVGGVEVRGWASGVAGLDLLDPRHLAERIHAVVLAGGSA